MQCIVSKIKQVGPRHIRISVGCTERPTVEDAYIMWHKILNAINDVTFFYDVTLLEEDQVDTEEILKSAVNQNSPFKQTIFTAIHLTVQFTDSLEMIKYVNDFKIYGI